MPLQEKIKFSSSTKNIYLVEELVDTLCEHYNIPPEHYGNILIAVSEAVNNAIEHGNKNDESKFVTVEHCITDKKGLLFSINDEGPGFNPQKIADPTAPENIAKARGRGVFLMRNLSDEVTFSEDGKTVHILFSLNLN